MLSIFDESMKTLSGSNEVEIGVKYISDEDLNLRASDMIQVHKEIHQMIQDIPDEVNILIEI